MPSANKNTLVFSLILGLLSGCATESSRSISVAPTGSVHTSRPISARIPIAIAGFHNRSDFGRGIFSDGQDRLGAQAQAILATHLQQTHLFNVLNRTNLNELAKEAAIGAKVQTLKGANYMISGNVTEFGRKEVGDHQLFGILGRGKSQIAYAKVALTIIDVRTSETVYTAQGAGEYSLTNREIIGFGGTAGYDTTLTGKVLTLAVSEAVNKLAKDIDNGIWQPVH